MLRQALTSLKVPLEHDMYVRVYFDAIPLGHSTIQYLVFIPSGAGANASF